MNYYLVSFQDHAQPDQIIQREENPFWHKKTMADQLISSCGGAYESEAELREKCKVPDFLCVRCDGIISLNFFNAKDLIEHKMCFNCDVWRKRLPDRKLAHTYIIKGVFYGDGGMSNDTPKYLGHGGSKFTMKKDDKVVTTNNLWCGGTISPYWREEFPDNAEFVKEGMV